MKISPVAIIAVASTFSLAESVGMFVLCGFLGFNDCNDIHRPSSSHNVLFGFIDRT